MEVVVVYFSDFNSIWQNVIDSGIVWLLYDNRKYIMYSDTIISVWPIF